MHCQVPLVELQRLGPVAQCHHAVDVLVVTGLVERGVERDAAVLQDVEAGEPRRGRALEDPQGGRPQRVVQLRPLFREVDCDSNDRRGSELLGDRCLGRGPAQIRVEAAAQHGRIGIALQPLGAGGKLHLIRMGEIEGELRRSRMPPCRLDLEAAQHDLLQPRRIVGLELARRNGIAPQPPAHGAHPLALAEWPLAGGEEVEQNAEREEIALRLVAHAQELLGRHVGGRAEGQAELLLHEVGKLVVAGKPEVEHHRLSARAKHDVARLDVEVDDVLLV